MAMTKTATLVFSKAKIRYLITVANLETNTEQKEFGPTSSELQTDRWSLDQGLIEYVRIPGSGRKWWGRRVTQRGLSFLGPALDAVDKPGRVYRLESWVTESCGLCFRPVGGASHPHKRTVSCGK